MLKSFYVIFYKKLPLAYVDSMDDAELYEVAMPDLISWEEVYERRAEDLNLPHAHDIPQRVWEVLKEN